MDVTEDKVNKLNKYDIDTAVELLHSLNLNSDGVDDVDEAQRRLRIYLSKRDIDDTSGPGSRKQWNAQNSAEVVQKIIAENTQARTSLQQNIIDVQSLIKRLPTPRLEELHEVFPNAESEIEDAISNLSTDECVILVAGETGAGKSTLLNLLLGELTEALLPVSHLSSTSVITELRYGETRKMTVHARTDGMTPEEVDLTDDAAKVLSEYVHQKGDRSDRFAYKRVEVYWPCDWLRGGITIVDTPGVGEDADLTEMVKEYLPKAFAFIYVINTPLAGGIDPDMLQDVMFSPHTEQNKFSGKFNPKSAIFVCNKWDQIHVSEQEKVKLYIMEKLRMIWPGFKQDQVFFLSVTRTIQDLKDNIISSDYRQLLNGIEKLIPVGLKSKLHDNFSIGSNVLKRSNFLIRSYIMDSENRAEQKLHNYARATTKLSQIENMPVTIKVELQEKMEKEIDQAIIRLVRYLRNKEVVDRLTFWKRSDCPKSSKGLEHLLELMQGNAQKRIKQEVDMWDKDNNIFQCIYCEVLAAFKDKFLGLQNELKRIEENFTEGKHEGNISDYHSDASQHNITDEDDVALSTKEKVIVGLAAPLWVPLGFIVGIFALPIFGGIAFHKQRKEAKEKAKIEENIEEEMSKLTQIILDTMIDSGKIRELVKDKISEMLVSFNKMIDRVPELIKADKRLLSKMQKDLFISSEDLSNIYRPLFADGMNLQSEIDCLYLRDIRSYNIDVEDLSDCTKLGDGSFATVYRACWRPDTTQKPVTVALKMFNDPITSHNATLLLTEEENLRDIKSSNIVTYYGTYVKSVEDKVYPVLVMEYCEETLENVIAGKLYKAPGKYHGTSDYRAAVIKAAKYGWQISCGLMALHAMGFAHRDMKPENILITNKGDIKLADLGLTKRVAFMKRTFAGSPLYMAPEVILEEKQTEKADIFGLAMVLWELWYGCCVLEEIEKLDPQLGQSRTKLVNCIKTFIQDPFPNPRCPPEDTWKDLLEKCWSLEPSKRPSAQDCCLTLSTSYLNRCTNIVQY